VDCAHRVAELMGGVLGWDEDTISREIESYTARVKAERDSQEQSDDHAADATRTAAPEIRPNLVSSDAL
jgi:glycerol-3-phosphate dehydrogenase